MLWSNLVAWLTVAAGVSAAAQSKGVRLPRTSNGLQDIVTWDEYSLKIHGERIAIFSGEIHPYRMPVHSLYTDLFQKVKALGFNAVSFYTFWGLHEPKRGAGVDFSGFRDLRPFIEAAQAAGLYLIARPGPYINAETTGGGFPGWGARDPALWRTSNASYVEAYQDYLGSLSEIIAEYQITNGGPIILVQAENEYSGYQPPTTEDFQYEKDILDLFHSKGVVVPTTSNDAWTGGHYKMVDIYGYDSYPNGFDCANPYNWSSDAVPETFFNDHMNISPGAPNGIMEFQGGGFDGWGGPGFAGCALRLGPEFERVFYKNQFAQSTTILNLYMIFGGTNFGGISHPGGYSSYDYGAAIAEDRTLREKYYELKLQANFIKVTPTFATTRPQNIGKTAGAFTGNPALKVTQTLDVVGNKTGFYIVRQADAASYAVQNYKLTLPTSAGNITIPQLGGSLTLSGRDSKIHVVDYAAGSTELLYSTGEIATWATIDNRDVIVLYGNEGESHETAFKLSGKTFDIKIVSGTGKVTSKIIGGNLVINYSTDGLTVVKIGDNILAYLLRRSDAYEFWSPNVPDVSAGKYANFNTKNPVLIKGGYLIRSVDIKSDTLQISGDLNSTTSLEIIAPAAVKKVVFNGLNLSTKRTPYGTLLVHKNAKIPAVTLPNLKALTWKSANSLPEIQADYDDSRWTVANHTTTVSPFQPLNTSVVLYASDYGYNTGNLLWRAHFVATGDEKAFWPTIIGGSAFGYSIWLDETFIGSFAGDATLDRYNQSYTFPKQPVRGEKHVITILQDHTGLEGDWWAGGDSFKTPRGILNYTFPGSPKTIVDTWKLTGNLGGEDYVDRARGPLNEGGLYAERQGWHLPGFDDRKWANARPTEGVKQPGVQFYRTTFELNVPSATDYPMSFVFGNSSLISHYRTQLYVNGWQFGKYVNAIGPQTRFPVPQGVLNYKGTNTLAVSLWAHDKNGAKLDDFHMEIEAHLESGLGQVDNLDAPSWTSRPLTY